MALADPGIGPAPSLTGGPVPPRSEDLPRASRHRAWPQMETISKMPTHRNYSLGRSLLSGSGELLIRVPQCSNKRSPITGALKQSVVDEEEEKDKASTATPPRALLIL
jgi:hypothetical protein